MIKLIGTFCCGAVAAAIGIYVWAVWYFKDMWR